MPSLELFKKKYSKYLSIYSDIVDHNFITTHPSVLKKQKKKLKYFYIFFLYQLIKILNVMMFIN